MRISIDRLGWILCTRKWIWLPRGQHFMKTQGPNGLLPNLARHLHIYILKPHAWHGNLICMKSVGWVITIYMKQTPHQPQDRWGILLLFFHFFRRKLQESPATVTSRLWEWPVGVWAKAWGREETIGFGRHCKSQRDTTESRGNIEEPKRSHEIHNNKGWFLSKHQVYHCSPSHWKES